MIKTVLVVDDNQDLLKMLSKALSKLVGWEVCTARSGLEALTKVRQSRPDLILLDVSMPEMDGLETVEKIRRLEGCGTKALPIILITARVQQHEMIHYQRLAVSGVISKPFDPMQLPRQIQTILSGLADRALFTDSLTCSNSE